jgi:hypothetical protein
LEEEGLRCDREGRCRTAYSLRPTYNSLRLMEGADIDQIAKNCRASVEMIEKYYAAHKPGLTLPRLMSCVRTAKAKRATQPGER